ncbi:MAG: hypothetical protein ACOCRX_04875, partial [Candidatus Woesearchaeota archaeon]
IEYKMYFFNLFNDATYDKEYKLLIKKYYKDFIYAISGLSMELKKIVTDSVLKKLSETYTKIISIKDYVNGIVCSKINEKLSVNM